MNDSIKLLNLKEEECVLYPISITPIAPLENPVLDLTK